MVTVNTVTQASSNASNRYKCDRSRTISFQLLTVMASAVSSVVSDSPMNHGVKKNASRPTIRSNSRSGSMAFTRMYRGFPENKRRLR